MSNGLSRNYNFYTSKNELVEPFDHSMGIKFEYTDQKFNPEFNWIFPELSTFITIDREVNCHRNSFIQPALGAWPIELSPIKMAESAIRLVKANRSNNFVTILKTEDKPAQYNFYVDPSWRFSDYKKFINNYIIGQMKEVALSGTASELSRLSKEFKSKRNLYLYVKTGTISEQYDSYYRDKHLLIIISNNDLSEDSKRTEELKFVTAFVSFYNIIPGAGFERYFEKYIRAIVNSESFKHYMNE
jgi:hypothetical protein